MVGGMKDLKKGHVFGQLQLAVAKKCMGVGNEELVYGGTSENGLPLLRNPPQCGQESTVPNYSLYYSVQYQETSVLRTPPK